MRRLLSLLAAVALGSCSDKPDVNGQVNGTIDGQVFVTAPVGGVVVSAYALDLDTGRQGQLLGASAPTDAAGHFHIDLGNAQGAILLVAKGVGGTYTEPSSGVVVHWDASTQMRAVFVEWSPNQDLNLSFELGGHANLIISPLSEWALAYAPARLTSHRDTTYQDALKSAIERWRDDLELDYWSIAPQDLTQGPVGAWNAAVQAGVYYSALSQLTLSMAQQSSISPAGLSTLVLLGAIRDDVSDAAAQLDGVGPGGQLTVGTCSTICRLTDATLRPRLSEAGANFLGTPSVNKSNITVTDAQQFLTRLSARQSDLWPSTGTGMFDTTPPSITVDGIQDAAILHDTVTARVTVFDTVEMGDVTVGFSRAGSPVTGFYSATTTKPSAQTVIIDLSMNTLQTTDGPIVLTIQAKDKAGNVATPVTLSLFIDNLGPGAIAGVALVGGRLQGARVQAWVYDGGVKGAKLGETTTDAAGVYSLQIENGTTATTILVEVSNPATGSPAQYVEPANGYTVVFSSDDVVSSILTNWHNGDKRSDGMVTPWTSMAAAAAKSLFASPLYNSDGAKWSAAVEDAFTLFEDHFAAGTTRISLRGVQPADLTATGVSTFNAQARYGFALASLSELADHHAVTSNATAATVNTLSLTKLLVADIGQDGTGVTPLLDGRTGSGQLVSGRVNLTSYVTRVDLATAGVDFMSNPRYKAPFVELDVDPLLEVVAGDGGRLYPASDPPIPYDKIPPSPVAFTTNTPADGTVLRGLVNLEATASDNRALATFAWEATSTVPLTAISNVLLDKGSAVAGPWVLSGKLSTDTLAEGTITVSAVAKDEALNVTHTSPRTFVVDRTAPAITITSAVAGGATMTNGGWTGASSVTISGTIAELHLASASYTWAGSTQALSVSSGGSWTITLPMTATGGYTLAVNATDAAGNIATTATITINRDASPPTIIVRPTSTGYDDSAMNPSVVDSGSPGGAVTYTSQELTFGLVSGGGRPIVKFTQLYATTSPSLPYWNFDVEDNHTPAATLELWARLSRSTGPLTGWFKVSAVVGADYNRQQVLSGGLHVDVMNVSDTYVLEYYAKDEFGNTSTTSSVTWQQTILPPPVRQRGGGACDCRTDTKCPSYYTLADTNGCSGNPGNNASGALVSSSTMKAAFGQLDNPNDVPVRVRIVGTVTATYSRGTFWANPPLTTVLPERGPCGSWTYSLDGTCPYTPIGNSSTEIVEQNLQMATNLVTGTSIAGTAQSLGGDYYEIPPHTTVTVALQTAGWSWVLDQAPVSDNPSVSSGANAIVNKTGYLGTHWRRCTQFSSDLLDCQTMMESVPYHYFTRFRVDLQASASLLASPAADNAAYTAAQGTNVVNATYSPEGISTTEDNLKYPQF